MTHDSSARQAAGQPGLLRGQSAPRRTEKQLWSAFRAGLQVDLRPNGKAGRNGGLATRGAVVRAKVIAAILCADHGPSNNARLALCGARITGSLDLSYARIEHPITFRDCVFDQPIVLAEARLGALTLDGCEFPGIDAPNLEVDGDLGLSGVSSSRAVRLTGAHLHRDVRLRGAHLRHGEDQDVALDADHVVVEGSVVVGPGFEASGTVTMAGARVNGSVRLDGAEITAHGKQTVAYHGDGMTVGHEFNAQELSAKGEVRLVDVTIASTLELRGAKLSNAGRVALRLDRAEISSSLYCDNGFTAVGEVCAIGAHVKGSVYLNNSELGTPTPAAGATRPADVALRLVRTKIDGDFGCWEGFVAHGLIDLARSSVTGEFRLVTTGLEGYPKAADLTNCQFASVTLSGEPPAGFLDLARAKADFFKDSAAYWHKGDIVLDEFEYSSIQMAWVTVKQREQWLTRAMEASRRKFGGDHDGYLPQPYDQLAAVYRRAGDDQAARRIQLAKHRRLNRVTSWRRWHFKIWYLVQDGVIGYGYAPLRALAWLVGLLVLGVLLFRYGATPYSVASGHRSFTLSNSVGYTLDLLLPTSALQERQVWQSSSGLGEVAAAGLVVFGWLLTATVFTAAARVLQRN
jgi:uncharacterized protein YjbI with pentapeptide repeats